jgi:serine/threonine protein kinase
MADHDRQRWLELEPHLDECLTAPEQVRCAKLAELRSRDPDLAERLERALSARDKLVASGFLETEILPTLYSIGRRLARESGTGAEWGSMSGSPHGTLESSSAAVPELGALMDLETDAQNGPHFGLEGRQFGPYRVLRLLGRGGMGSVWLAERVDGLFERRVALKVMHSALINTREQDRFARERQIVGALRHPHIAELLDAGFSDDGQPYLALEYVDGMNIVAHCDALRLPVTRRIELMVQVLVGVQYAHGNLVIHRDLKPSNILITGAHDVKLLDFGIAKLMSDGVARETDLTAVVGRALTPEFASPEQLSGQPLTIASDIYSLGVVLYLLLCGERPYRLLRQTRGALEEAIANAEPVRPSSRTPADPVAQLRSTTPKRLERALQGDLDTIVLKALRKDPRDRYHTADAFRQDLERFLAGAPILARSDSRAYRAGKFLRRHWGRVSAALLVLIALIVAAVVSIEQARAARAHQLVAEREAKRSKAVLEFLLDLFSKNTDQQSAPVQARELTARELLEIGARQVTRRLEADPDLQAEVLNELADIYAQLKLGEQAGKLRREAIDALERALGPRHEKVAASLLVLAQDVAYTNQRALAREALTKARAILDDLADHSSEARGTSWLVSAQLNRYESVPALFRDAEQARRHFHQHPPRAFWSGPFKALELEGIAHHLAGHYAQAEATQRQAIAEIELRAEHAAAWRINPLIRIAEAQLARIQLDDAVATFREALALSLQINGESNGQTLQTRAKLGGALYASGQRREGLSVLDATLGALERGPETDTSGAWSSLRQFRGAAMFAEGHIEEADALWSAEVAERRKYFPGSIPLARALVAQAGVDVMLGRYDAADAALEEGCRLWRECAGSAAVAATANDCWLGRARLAIARNQPGAAAQAVEHVVPLPDPAALPLEQIQAMTLLAQARLQQADAAGAQSASRAALAQLEGSRFRARFPQLEAAARLRLGQALHQIGAMAPALAELNGAVSLFAENGAEQSPWLGEAKVALARCLLGTPATGQSGQRARLLLEEAKRSAIAHPALGKHLADLLGSEHRD